MHAEWIFSFTESVLYAAVDPLLKCVPIRLGQRKDAFRVLLRGLSKSVDYSVPLPFSRKLYTASPTVWTQLHLWPFPKH